MNRDDRLRCLSPGQNNFLAKMAAAAELAAIDDSTHLVTQDTPSHRADASISWGTLIRLREHAMRSALRKYRTATSAGPLSWWWRWTCRVWTWTGCMHCAPASWW